MPFIIIYVFFTGRIFGRKLVVSFGTDTLRTLDFRAEDGT